MLIRRRPAFLALLLSFVVFAGCTRPENEIHGISVAPPDATKEIGKLSLTLTHVVINVSGVGIQQAIVYNWDACSDCPEQNPVPATFDIDIPSGDKRFIQVLAVYKDSEGENINFQYGDTTIDVNLSRVIVPIGISNVASGSILEGRVSGRYAMPGANNVGEIFPTGVVNVKLHPGSKPAIIVERESILAGWFSFFMMKGISLSYEMSDGTLLFGGPVHFGSDAMNPDNYGAGNVFKTWVPQHRVMRSESTGMTWRSRPPHIKMYGYFGSPALNSGKTVCLDAGGTMASSMFQGDSHTQKLSLQAAVPDGTLNFFSNLSSAYHSGGTLASACGLMNPNDLYRNYLKITQGHIESRNSNAEPFFGPFRQMPSSGGPFEILVNAGADSRRVSGQLLPGVRSLIDSVKVYKSVGLGAQYYHFDRVPCSAIAAGGFFNFVPAGSADVGSDGMFSVVANVTTEDIVNGVSTAICPALGEIVWPIGEEISSQDFGRCKGCEAVQANQFYASMPVSKFALDQCVPINMQLGSSQLGRAVVSRQTVTVSPMVTPGTLNAAFYQDRDCSTVAANLDIAANETKRQVYYKVTGVSGTHAGTIAITATTGGSTSIQNLIYDFSRTSIGKTTELRFGNLSPGLYSMSQCADVELWSLRDDRAVNWSGFDNLVLQSVPAGAVTFHPNCAAAMGSMGSSSISSVAPGSYYKSLALRSENSSLFDIGVRVIATDGMIPVSSHAMVLKNPLSYRPTMWFRGEPESVALDGGYITHWFSRMGSYVLSGCGTVSQNCPTGASFAGTTGVIHYVRQNDSTDLLTTGSLFSQGSGTSTTIALIKLADGNASGSIFEHLGTLGTQPFFRLSWNESTEKIVLERGTMGVVVPPYAEETFSAGAAKWAVVALRRERSGNLNTFSMNINGNPVGSTIPSSDLLDWDQLVVGGSQVSYGGAMSELIFTTQALSNDQILETYKYLKFKYPFLGL